MNYDKNELLKLRREESVLFLEKVLANPAERKKTALFKLTLEDFKQFNNTFGYRYGDLLLEQVAAYLSSFQGAQVWRISGVEFLLALCDIAYSKADELSTEIASRFDDTWNIEDMDCICAVNIGMIFPALPETSVQRVLEILDYATRESLAKGQNVPVLYDEELAGVERRTRLLAKQLKDMLACDEENNLQVYFRPTIRSADGCAVRAESYLRLYNPEYGTIGVATLMPIAEESGIACALNIYILRKACAQISKMLKAGCDFENVTVPLSAVQFLQKDFAKMVEKLLAEYEIPAEKLAFEITESTLINSFAQISEMLQIVSDMGIETILSDFGTGYSGVTNILDLPVKTLKLDRLFVYRMNDDDRCCAVIEGLIAMAHKLGMKVIAEGVESQRQKDLLESYGCDYQQGFYYSPTLPAEELLAYFAQ